jgi:MFS transporter, FHS family, glucose/mannose:H+ symporter
MQTTNKNTIWLWTAISFFAFFVFGFSDNLKGATIPAFLRDLDFSYSVGGSVLLGIYIGFLIATLATGILADWAGNKTVLVIAGVCLTAGILGFSMFSTFWPLFFSMLVVGLGLGAIELGANNIIVELHAAQKARYLNLMSVLHGFGSMSAPLYAGFLLAAETSWRQVYQGALILVAVMLVLTLLAKYPREVEHEKQAISFKKLARIAFKGQTPWYYFLIAIYVSTEIGIASWIVEFLQTQKGLDVVLSTQMLSLYFGLMMAGRFLGSFFVERVGYLKFMLLVSLAAFASIALGIFGPGELFYFLPLSGLFLSIIFPTVTAAVSDQHTENQGAILGLLFTFAGLGGMAGPWLVGVSADLLGLQLGFSLSLLFCALMIGALVILLVGRRRELA